jgi:HrpA-like RNA helicase
LTRDDIEPAILRSSLDLVVLQLIYLQLNPLEFPFIDPPDPDTLKTSLQLLKDLDCVDANNVITLRGELFVKLNIDPRFSAFLVDAYIEHGSILEPAAAIAAILAAPGSLFLIGTTDEERTMNENRVADVAQKYDSDLLYFVSIFNQWRNIGMTIDSATRKCSVCHMVWNKGNICRACRAAHSTTYSYNNKILNITESVYNALIEVIKRPCWQLNPCSVQEANESDIIGTNLYKYFPENYGYLLTSSQPTSGVRMIRNKFEAHIRKTSAFMRPSIGHRYFIAMSIINRPGRRYLVDRLHPCRPPEDLGQNHSKK